MNKTVKGERKMAVSQAQTEWQKKNTVMVSVRLQKGTDADILKFLEGKQKQTVIKQALRLLMETENK